MNTTDNTTGWVKLYRSILQWEWWDDPKATRLFIYCLIKANPKDRKWRGRTIERGTFITSYSSIKNDTSLSVQEIRTAINRLKSTGEITTETTNEATKITITNYDKYQDTPQAEQTNQQAEQQASNKRATSEQQAEQQASNKRATSEQQASNKRATSEQQASNNNEEYKNDKNDKKVNIDDDADYARDAHEIIKNNFEDLESENVEADADIPQQAPTPQPPAPGDSHGDRYRPIGELYQELRPTYYAESEATNALRMKINREQHRLLTTQEVGQYFDQYQETLVAGGCTIETMKDYRLHFRNWLIKQLQPKPQTQNNRHNGNNQTERPRQIADASQFVERL